MPVSPPESSRPRLRPCCCSPRRRWATPRHASARRSPDGQGATGPRGQRVDRACKCRRVAPSFAPRARGARAVELGGSEPRCYSTDTHYSNLGSAPEASRALGSIGAVFREPADDAHFDRVPASAGAVHILVAHVPAGELSSPCPGGHRMPARTSTSDTSAVGRLASSRRQHRPRGHASGKAAGAVRRARDPRPSVQA